ncbi:alpha/beta hydrolase [Microbacterium invictum]|uniref:Alpha-beta hydrolase superfamily lysophospholipase n=1 Tax=Microbacterium invictum TaxID=515415 RepID=A0AA40SLE0_9MICO|nr:alpha/beta hydrolase [Microbacterium invictum]MBB4138297.1 alpha-beta hydrolase superfamily lysophospholipase [Microbacterium invictum]
MTAEWIPDVLGAPFQQLTLELDADVDGPVAATLVRRRPHALGALVRPLRDVDVLYVHGWSDYFFQTALAEFWNGLGARFYALDLRKYGRSLRPGQTPGYISSLDDYDADIDAALAAMPGRAGRPLVLMGHSTGGLTLTLWAARHPGVASALVLNSPWLELQTGAFARQALTPLVHARARLDPLGAQPAVDLGFYTRAQRELETLPTGHEDWRPERGFSTHPGWLAAVIAGHAKVAAGVDVGCPALVLLSTTSVQPFAWSEAMTSADAVLTVDDIARAATRIGRDVTLARIDGAIHDVFLSRPAARDAAYAALRRWVLRGALER